MFLVEAGSAIYPCRPTPIDAPEILLRKLGTIPEAPLKGDHRESVGQSRVVRGGQRKKFRVWMTPIDAKRGKGGCKNI